MVPRKRRRFHAEFDRIPSTRNYAQEKKKTAAWFVSNCQATSGRFEYVEQLKVLV